MGSSGNTINVAGSYIDIHDNENVYLSVDKAVVSMAQPAKQPPLAEAHDDARPDESPLLENDKVAACFEQGLLTAGKPYNQLFCLMAAMMARRLLTDTTVPGFVRMVSASWPALLQDGITVENYVGAINDLTQKSRYSFTNYVTDQKTMVDFIRSCYPKTSKGKERAVSQQMVAKANKIFLFLK